MQSDADASETPFEEAKLSELSSAGLENVVPTLEQETNADEESTEVWVNQHAFFSFIQSKLSRISMFSKSMIFSQEEWHQRTRSPHKWTMRSKKLKAIDSALEDYNERMHLDNRIVKTSLILCTDETRIGGQSLISK